MQHLFRKSSPKRIPMRWKSVKLRNLRRDSFDKSAWVPAGTPTRLRADLWRPEAQLELPEIGLTASFWRNGALLGVTLRPLADDITDDDLAANPAVVGEMPGSAIHYSLVAPGIVKVMMQHDQPVFLSYNVAGEFSLLGNLPQLPTIKFIINGEQSVSEPIGSVRLSGQGAGLSGSMLPADLKPLTKQALAAYKNLADGATRRGFFMQPVLARYRFEDAAGDNIFASPVILLSASTGFQCCGQISASSADDMASLSCPPLMAQCFRARLYADSALPVAWQKIVRRLVVEVSDPIDPVDGSLLCDAHVEMGASGAAVSFSLPGLTGAAAAADRMALVTKCLLQGGRAFREVWSVDNPFSGSIDGSYISPRADAPFSSFNSLVCHNESYSSALLAGEVMLLANRRRQLFQGYGINALTVKQSAGASAWQGAVETRIARAESAEFIVPVLSQANRARPTALSALIMIPDPNATSVKISVSNGSGSFLSQSFPLKSLPSVGIAYYLAPSPVPIMPDSLAAQIDVGQPSVAHTIHYGELTVADAAKLSVVHDRVRVAASNIHAILPSPQTGGMWDFSRRKFIIAADDGINLVTLDARCNVHAIARLDGRGVASPNAVCNFTDDVGLGVVALAGSDLVKINRSGVKTLVADIGPCTPAWCEHFKELWLISPDGRTRRLLNSGELVDADLPDDVACSYATNFAGRLLLCATPGLFDASSERFPDSGNQISISYRALFNPNTPSSTSSSFSPPVVRWVRTDISASDIKGKLSLCGDRNTRVPETLLDISIQGALNAPLIMPVMFPRRDALQFTLSATVSPDARFHSLDIFS